MGFEDFLGWVLASLTATGMKPSAALTLVEFSLVAALIVLARVVVWVCARYVRLHFGDLEGMVRKGAKLAMPATAGVTCWMASLLLQDLIPGHLLWGAALLMVVWFMERALRIIPGPKAIKMFVGIVTFFVLLVLSIDSLRPIFGLLDQTQFVLGGLTLRVGPILQGIFFFCILSWLTAAATTGLAQALENNSRFSPSLQNVITKVFKFFAICLVVLIALSVMGVNVTHLAFFGGALAIGIGWSLRPITSNLISGLFILMDRSIKPGDVISIDDETFGQVKALHSRYVVLRRRDGKDVLIPNEVVMNQPVINWSYANKAVRNEVEIPVAYESDLERVQVILREAVNGVPRVQSVPPPIVFIKEFAERGVIFMVRFWSVDPEMGVNNLKGDVNMACWKALQVEGVTVPKAQRVVQMVAAVKTKPTKAKARKRK